MGYDKAVDSAKLDADILSIADAIRTKGGTDAPLNFPAEFVSAIQAIQAGGGSGAQIGEYIPADTTKYPKWVFSPAKHFIVCTDTPTGNGIRTSAFIFVDWSNPDIWPAYAGNTNQAGTQMSSCLKGHKEDDWSSSVYFTGIARLCITETEKTVEIAVTDNGDTGSAFGAFPAGVKYEWMAW